MVRPWLLWTHRAALAGAGVTFLYFTVTLVLPLTTMGDPVYDTAMLRARWYDGGILPLHLAALLMALVLALKGPSRLWPLLAFIAGAGALAAITAEMDLVTRYGDLVEPRDLAEFRLAAGRWTTFLLSALSLWAFWRGRHG